MTMNHEPPSLDSLVESKRAIEAIVLVASEPTPVALLSQILELAPEVVEVLCRDLADEYEAQNRGFRLVEVAGGWSYQTHEDLHAYVEQYAMEGIPNRLSSAALETLSIVAYKQPISRAQMSAIRGVNVDGVLRTLEQRGYVEEVGRDIGPGQAVLFGTTPFFLERLGLASTDDLPALGDFVPAAHVVEALEQTLRFEGDVVDDEDVEVDDEDVDVGVDEDVDVGDPEPAQGADAEPGPDPAADAEPEVVADATTDSDSDSEPEAEAVVDGAAEAEEPVSLDDVPLDNVSPLDDVSPLDESSALTAHGLSVVESVDGSSDEVMGPDEVEPVMVGEAMAVDAPFEVGDPEPDQRADAEPGHGSADDADPESVADGTSESNVEPEPEVVVDGSSAPTIEPEIDLDGPDESVMVGEATVDEPVVVDVDVDVDVDDVQIEVGVDKAVDVGDPEPAQGADAEPGPDPADDAEPEVVADGTIEPEADSEPEAKAVVDGVHGLSVVESVDGPSYEVNGPDEVEPVMVGESTPLDEPVDVSNPEPAPGADTESGPEPADNAEVESVADRTFESNVEPEPEAVADGSLEPTIEGEIDLDGRDEAKSVIVGEATTVDGPVVVDDEVWLPSEPAEEVMAVPAETEVDDDRSFRDRGDLDRRSGLRPTAEAATTQATHERHEVDDSGPDPSSTASVPQPSPLTDPDS